MKGTAWRERERKEEEGGGRPYMSMAATHCVVVSIIITCTLEKENKLTACKTFRLYKSLFNL